MTKSEEFIKKVVEGDKIKKKIYNFLKIKSSSRRVTYENLNLTKYQFGHYIEFLIKNNHVKMSNGKCDVYGNRNVHILASNPNCPFKARTKKQLIEEKNKKEENSELIKKYTRVIRNLNRPGSDFACQRKKITPYVNIQSSLNSI